jgi:hypothetical protein
VPPEEAPLALTSARCPTAPSLTRSTVLLEFPATANWKPTSTLTVRLPLSQRSLSFRDRQSPLCCSAPAAVRGDITSKSTIDTCGDRLLSVEPLPAGADGRSARRQLCPQPQNTERRLLSAGFGALTSPPDGQHRLDSLRRTATVEKGNFAI